MKLGLFFSDFEGYSKSAQGMILFLLVTCSYTPILLKNAEKPTVIWLFTQNCLKSTVNCQMFLSNVSLPYARVRCLRRNGRGEEWVGDEMGVGDESEIGWWI